ncbi:MAG: B12-binding domain-containing radical SAM protein [Phycisphaerae bacterium]|nr:B12-binding domain-containing radical SAM protein [Phycisphaerae bacterium]
MALAEQSMNVRAKLKCQVEDGVPKEAGGPVFKHVACVYPYRREINNAGFAPPLGLEYIAAVIEPYASKIDIVDLRKETKITTDFLHEDTDLVCFSVNWDRDVEFLHDQIRSVPPHILTLVGGRHATENPEYWLSTFPNVDAIIRGDGEEAVEEFCQSMPFEQIGGLSFRKDGKICHNPINSSASVKDFYPNRGLRRYTYELCVENVSTGLAIDTVAASRGCPYNCKFCSFNRNPWGEKRKWSGRSPESVVDELAEIKAPIVGFMDDLFTYDMDRVEQICDLLLARGIKKIYFFNARLEIAKRPDVLKKMKRAGFAMVLLGIESTQDKTLKSMGKGFNTAKIREYFKILRNCGMILHGYFILGNIGESENEMKQIVPFAHELGVDTLGLSMLRVSPHTGLEELVKNNPGYHIAESGKIYSDHCSMKQLRQLRRHLNRSFYSIPQIFQLLHKGSRMGMAKFLPKLLLRLPLFSWHLTLHYRRRAKHHAKRKLRV